MDYLDPKKRFQHTIILLVGYVLVGLAILIATIILLQMAYGYARGKNGQIIQNGFVYLSSQPSPAKIYINNQLNNSQTNTRLTLQAGSYRLQLKRNGYRDWQRSIVVQGGDVQHFDYPLLIPKNLITTSLKSYNGLPGLATQSPDGRWLLVQPAGSILNFDLYDLKNPTRGPVALTLPAALLSKASINQSWQLLEWSNDNQHVLLQHNYDNKTEFIVLDRSNPDQSINLNTSLSVSPSMVNLNNKKYDQYYLYDDTNHTLQTASLSSPTPTAYLEHVLAYKSYGNDTMLFVTDNGAPTGQVNLKMQVGNQQYLLRNLPTGGSYVLDLTGYNGSLYVAVGSSNEGRVYIYQDPVGQLNNQPTHLVVPKRVLRLPGVNYVAFSANAQFIMAENGTAVATYDIQYEKSYTYTLTAALDAPQSHVSWMDGDRLAYTSQAKLVIVDYDNTNQQFLMSLDAGLKSFFAPNMKYVYGLAATAPKPAYNLTQTALLLPADL